MAVPHMRLVVAARHGPEVDGLSWDTVWYLAKWFVAYSTLIFGAAHIAWRTVWKPTGVSGNLNQNQNHGFTLESNNFRP